MGRYTTWPALVFVLTILSSAFVMGQGGTGRETTPPAKKTMTKTAPAKKSRSRSRSPQLSSVPENTNSGADVNNTASDSLTDQTNRLAEQVKVLSRFLYLLGGVARDMAQIDEAARRNEASPSAIQQNDKNKMLVKTSLGDVRQGLDKLEQDFRASSHLQRSYEKLAGVAAAAATAEQEAANNHFDQAGRILLGVFNRLVDALNDSP